jgi:hypothetical protein
MAYIFKMSLFHFTQPPRNVSFQHRCFSDVHTANLLPALHIATMDVKPGNCGALLRTTIFDIASAWGSSVFKGWIIPVLEPRPEEKLKLISQKWSELDPSLRLPQQAAGRSNNSCGATYGIMEQCNFSCTSCYLPAIANHCPALSFAAVRQQLDALRAYLGPTGKAQITSGEVTLLPQNELGRIIAYARSIGLDPMLMTNGQRLLEDPRYLPTLVAQYGLEKIYFHIDTTQKGRTGLSGDMTEEAIHPIRDQFASLIKQVRNKTGRRLRAAHTITITDRNFADIPQVMRWMLSNLDSFRMISFQPSARIGRTCDRVDTSIDHDSIWAQICKGLGRQLNRHAMCFGHPECSTVCPVIVVSFGQRHEFIETARAHKRWDQRFFTKILSKCGGFNSVHSDLVQTSLKLVSLLIRNPDILLELPFYGLYRLWGIRSWFFSFIVSVLSLRPIRIRPLAIVVHKFMSETELTTPLGKERLRACVFKVPVDGCMVSMCELNATSLRKELNRSLQRWRRFQAT